MQEQTNVQKEKNVQKKLEKKSFGKWILMIIVLLIVCVAATTIALMDRLNGYLMTDVGAIELDLGKLISEDEWKKVKDRFNSIDFGDCDQDKEEGDKKEKKASFQVTDGNAVWETETQIAIFDVNYEGEGQKITVQSSGGDKVIAPGTTQSYTFKVKNTGEVALDYLVDIDAYVTPEDTKIPVDSRLVRYDGEWIVGGNEKYVEIEMLDKAEDSGTLSAGKYGYYTLDWVWNFESGDDEYDTLLGNEAVQENLTFTIEIHTVATVSENPDAEGGLTSIQTGDSTNISLILLVSAGAVVFLFLLIVLKKKNDERIAPEAEKVSGTRKE